MKEILHHLFEHKTLTKNEAYEVLKKMASGDYNAAQIAAFITVYMMRSITVEELEGFRNAMLELCVPVDLKEYNTIDVCGTGGDSKDTFNISTISAFVVAAAGVRVAKHGNYGVSSVSGSSSVMEYLGYQFTADIDHLRQKIDKAGICFMHAPLFHPAVKNVAPIRKDLGVKTFFNMLGPMINPAQPQNQMVGVFNLELARLYAYLYQKEQKNYAVVHALDGYDEISLTGAFKLFTNRSEQLLQPEDIGFHTLLPHELSSGGTVKDAAQIFLQILKGEGTPAQNTVVCANAGIAIHCANPYTSIENCIALAKEMLESKKAWKTFTLFMPQ
ncbi:MAG: anthranilate phosphoribosyltransferase [Cytophagales bacterium]|nr:MAG: anthranilate phosphoribosyltransferase [Cytophagales bacterium]